MTPTEFTYWLIAEFKEYPTVAQWMEIKQKLSEVVVAQEIKLEVTKGKPQGCDIV